VAVEGTEVTEEEAVVVAEVVVALLDRTAQLSDEAAGDCIWTLWLFGLMVIFS